MLRLSTLLGMSCLVMAALSVAAVTMPANTPSDYAPQVDDRCLLTNMVWTGSLDLVPTFNPKLFHYTCSCTQWPTGPMLTQVQPYTLDSTSSVEVSHNGVWHNLQDMNDAISNDGADGNVYGSPRFVSDMFTFAPGVNTFVVSVHSNNGEGGCNYEYILACTPPPPQQGGSVVGDPQFVGLRGQNYQVHGVSGEIYNIVSDKDLQYNSRFVFLDSGACPVVNGRKQKGCFSHPGSYLGELGLKTRAGDRIHLVTGEAKQGFQSIEVNGKQLGIGDSVVLADNLGFVSYNTTHLASVQVGNWDFEFENSDMYVNQKVHLANPKTVRSHGLLGQTWRETTYPNAIKYIQGQVDDYVIRDGDIFGDNFVFNTHN